MNSAPAEEEVLSWVKTLSNWGRWGDDDHLGTLNYITDEVRRAAVADVRSGRAVSCAWQVEAGPRLDGRPNRFMVATGEALAQPDPSRHAHAATDILQLQVHGYQLTHLDSLSHWIWDASMYNGFPAQRVTSDGGALDLGIENVVDGVSTRGVLLDVAAVRGVDALGPGDGVFPEDLEEAERRQGIHVRSGDAVLLHTGFSRTRRENPAALSPDKGWPGWSAACLPWLHDREVAVIGAETSNEVMPNGYAALAKHPIHSVGIAAMGLWLIDNCNLERLAAACKSADQWTFLLTLAPILVRGATGSPLTPIALM